jgi:hypothetical protein
LQNIYDCYEIKPITSNTTKVSVSAVEDYVLKDKATADEIIDQIQFALDSKSSPGNPKSTNDPHGQIRNQVEQEYSDLKYRHPRIMDGIVSFFR